MQRYVSEGYLANLAARLFFQAMDRTIRPKGLTPAYVPVLLTLSDQGEMTQSQLASAIAIEQPTMAATLGRMERDGLLTRSPDPDDRRKFQIALTEQGRAQIEVVRTAVEDINDVALVGLSAEQRSEHRRAMMTIIGNLEAALVGGAQ